MELSTIKQHVESFISEKMTALGTEYHDAVRSFYAFLEGKSAEAEAVDLLKGLGYTVTEPFKQ